MRVVGIDYSITKLGIARITQTGSETPKVTTRMIPSAPAGTGAVDPKTNKPKVTLLDRRNRMQSITRRVIEFGTADYDPEVEGPILTVIEAPLYRAPMRTNSEGERVPITGGGHAHDRSWGWGQVVQHMFKYGIVVEVSTTTLKSYASGKGSGRKAGVLASMAYMFPDMFVDDDNIADALVLAAMGARQLGSPVEPSPQRVNPAAMNSVDWPSYTQQNS